MHSVLIKNGTVIDGTGAEAVKLDVLIEDDRIINIAPEIKAHAQTVIDAKGKIVSPGFIDIQNHSDSYWQLFDNPGLDSLVSQGYTTILVGQCGASLAPILSPDGLLPMQKWHALNSVNSDWSSFAELAKALASKNYGTNIASLVGYSTLRRGLLGDQTRGLDDNEVKGLLKILEQSLDAGAFGLSCGRAYSHEYSVSNEELIPYARLLSSNNSLLSVHLKSEGQDIIQALDETLNLAEQSGVSLEIAHLKIQNKANWLYFKELLTRLETARHRGVKVHFDVYPYDTVWQVLYSYLPHWATEGGRAHMLEQLHNPEQKVKILQFIETYQNDLQNLLLVSTANGLAATGKPLVTIAKDLGISISEALLMVVEQGGSEVLVFDGNLNQEQVMELSMHPLSFIASDGAGFPSPHESYHATGQDRLVHPRCYGAAPRFLKWVLQSKTITLSEAIFKLSGGPSSKIGLTNRGTIAIGNFADIVIFDPETISDTATLTNPYQTPIGVETVLVNGQIEVLSGIRTAQQGGVFLRKK